MSAHKDYHVALSFAGEDREYAEALSRELKELGLRVFYDLDEQSKLLGENLYIFLSDLYQNKTQYVVPLLSKHYAAKLWTSHELKAAQAQAMVKDGAFILPVRLDDTEISGILQVISFLPVNRLQDIKPAAEIIYKKVKGEPNASSAAMRQATPKRARAQYDLSISSHQTRLENIYKEVNQDLDIWYMYGYLCRTIGYLCKKLIKNRVEKVDFIRPISWLISLATNIGTDVHDSLIAKYPDCCPHCLEFKCICHKTGKRPRVPRAAYQISEEVYERYEAIMNQKPDRSFDAAISTIMDIYEANQIVWHFSGPGHQIGKLQEEVAEIHEAISVFLNSKKPLKAVSEEIADVLAWLLSAWAINFPNSSLDNEFTDYYLHGCPVCQREPCACQKYSGRPEGLIDLEFLLEVKSSLHKLGKILTNQEKEINELIRSIDKAAVDQNQIVARRALAQTAYRLRAIKNKLSGKDDEERRRAVPLIISLLEELKVHPQKLL